MTNYFFDSSALLKRYVTESGSLWVRGITAASTGNVILIAQFTPVELLSAIMRRVRSAQLNARQAKALRVLAERHYTRQYSGVEFTEAIRIRAEDLLEKYQLRAADAIQLASALDVFADIRQLRRSQLTFVCADHRLLSAAIAEGLHTDDPNLHP